MPCDSRITISLELDAARIEVLAAALKNLGFAENYAGYIREGVKVRLVGKELVISAPYGVDVNAIRSEIQVATSKEIVNRASVKFNWRINWTANNKAEASKITYGR